MGISGHRNVPFLDFDAQMVRTLEPPQHASPLCCDVQNSYWLNTTYSRLEANWWRELIRILSPWRCEYGAIRWNVSWKPWGSTYDWAASGWFMMAIMAVGTLVPWVLPWPVTGRPTVGWQPIHWQYWHSSPYAVGISPGYSCWLSSPIINH